jgi:Tfp pilus assembly protein PilO
MNFHSKSIIALVLVVGALFLGYFGLYPKWTSYSEAKTNQNTAFEQKQKLEQAQSQLNTFLSEYRSHAAEASLLNTALPLDQSQLYNVLADLDKLAAASGMTLGTLGVIEKPQSDVLGAAANSIQSVTVNLNVTGAYPSFKNFISHLETNLRVIDVTSTTIQSNTAQGASSFTYSVIFTTYYQK